MSVRRGCYLAQRSRKSLAFSLARQYITSQRHHHLHSDSHASTVNLSHHYLHDFLARPFGNFIITYTSSQQTAVQCHTHRPTYSQNYLRDTEKFCINYRLQMCSSIVSVQQLQQTRNVKLKETHMGSPHMHARRVADDHATIGFVVNCLSVVPTVM